MTTHHLQLKKFMFLKLNHQKLDIYNFSQAFVFECYKLSKYLPDNEKFGMISQIRRAALSVHLNIAEGASRKLRWKEKGSMKFPGAL